MQSSSWLDPRLKLAGLTRKNKYKLLPFWNWQVELEILDTLLGLTGMASLSTRQLVLNMIKIVSYVVIAFFYRMAKKIA